MASFKVVIEEDGVAIGDGIECPGALEDSTTVTAHVHPVTQTVVVNLSGVGHPDKGR